MINKDQLQRFLFEDAPVRGELVRLNEAYQSIVEQHRYPPIIRQLLGEALAAVSLLSSIIKFKGRVTIQFRGKGKLKLLLAQCNHLLHIRGLVQYEGDLSENELQETFKQGLLAIMMDPDVSNKQRYQGIVEWQGKSLAESLEGYFNQSEQLPTRIWLAVNETAVSGLLLQVLPKGKPELFREDWNRIICLTDTITSKELLSLDNRILLHKLYSEEDVRLFQPSSVTFQCNCSIARSENAVLLLGKKEAEQALQQNSNIIVTCEFCNREFLFDQVDVTRIFKKGENPSSTQLH